MKISKEEFTFLYSEDTRIRHSHKRIGNRIIKFVVQMELLIGNKWHPVIRYDTSHGFAHKDIVHPSGEVDKLPMAVQDFNDALTLAEEELRIEWKFFRMQYLRRIKGGEKNE